MGVRSNSEPGVPRARTGSARAVCLCRAVALCVVCVGVALLAWAADGWTTALAACLVAASAIGGYRLGAGRIAGSGLGVVAAVFAGPAMGRMIEPAVTWAIGFGGVAGRVASLAAAGLAVVLASIVLAGVTVRWLDRMGFWSQRQDSVIGGIVGAMQGLALAVAAAWVLLAVPMESPHAGNSSGNVRDPAATYLRRARDPSPWSGSLAASRDRLARSGLGRVAAWSNPIAGSRMLLLAEAFAEVSRDDDALRWFLDTPVMRELREYKSYNTAVSLASGDVFLTHFFTGAGEGVDAVTLWGIMTNDTILMILDETTVLADAGPMTPRVERAVHEARRKIGSVGGGDGSPVGPDHPPGER